jgi:hypothetical protein
LGLNVDRTLVGCKGKVRYIARIAHKDRHCTRMQVFKSLSVHEIRIPDAELLVSSGAQRVGGGDAVSAHTPPHCTQGCSKRGHSGGFGKYGQLRRACRGSTRRPAGDGEKNVDDLAAQNAGECSFEGVERKNDLRLDYPNG